jgi:hypothetical protein
MKRYARYSFITFNNFIKADELLKIYLNCDLFVIPRSNQQLITKYTFPSKLFEFMLIGSTPILMNKLEGIPKEYDSYLNYLSDFNNNWINTKACKAGLYTIPKSFYFFLTVAYVVIDCFIPVVVIKTPV